MSIRYAYGESRPVTAPIATAQVVSVGDMVGLQPGTITAITFTSTSTTATVTGATTGLAVGQYFYNSPNVPAGTYISVLSGSTITLSQAATLSGTSVPTNVLTGGNTLIRAQDYIYPGAGIGAPSAPVIADSGIAATSGGFAASATLVKVSFQWPWGEGVLSAASNSVTPTATHTLSLAAITLPWPALWINIYTSVAGAAYQLVGQAQTSGGWGGSSTQLLGPGTGPATNYAPVAVTAQMLAQYAFAQIFTGLSGCTKAAGVSQITGQYTANVCRVDTGTNTTFYGDLDGSYTPNVGDYYAPAFNSAATTLQSQILQPCAVNNRTLACAQIVAAGTTYAPTGFPAAYGPGNNTIPTNVALFKLITNVIKPGGY